MNCTQFNFRVYTVKLNRMYVVSSWFVDNSKNLEWFPIVLHGEINESSKVHPPLLHDPFPIASLRNLIRRRDRNLSRNRHVVELDDNGGWQHAGTPTRSKKVVGEFVNLVAVKIIIALGHGEEELDVSLRCGNRCTFYVEDQYGESAVCENE